MERAQGSARGLVLALAAALALSAAPAPAEGFRLPWADGQRHLGLELFVGLPSARPADFPEAFPGLSLRYLASRNLELSLDYAFMGFEYYYPESPSGPWRGPVRWSAMPGRFSSLRSSWIFYHTRHFLAPTAWLVAPMDYIGLPFALRLGLGPGLSLVLPSEAAKYYLGLADAYAAFEKDFDVYLGLSLRLGLEYRTEGMTRLGFEYLFIVDSLSEFAAEASRDGASYFARSGNFVFFAGVRL
jgi:hypothetical protein